MLTYAEGTTLANQAKYMELTTKEEAFAYCAVGTTYFIASAEDQSGHLFKVDKFKETQNEGFSETWAETMEDDRVEDYLDRNRKRLLDLEYNWDGAEAKPYGFEFVDRVLNFADEFAKINNYASFLVSKINIVPVSEEKIDLYWRLHPHLELLIIFNKDGSVSFYGDNTRREEIIQGDELPDSQDIYLWMERLSDEMGNRNYTM